jgi:hypothetical protein
VGRRRYRLQISTEVGPRGRKFEAKQHPSTLNARRQSRLVRRGGRDDAHARSGGVMPLPNWRFCKPESADWLGVLPSVLPTATGSPFRLSSIGALTGYV